MEVKNKFCVKIKPSRVTLNWWIILRIRLVLMTLESQQLPKDLPFQVVVILRYSFEASLRCLLQEGVKTENDHINLKVAGQDGSVVQFKIKRHTPLSKLMKAYCERQVRRLAPPRGLPCVRAGPVCARHPQSTSVRAGPRCSHSRCPLHGWAGGGLCCKPGLGWAC